MNAKGEAALESHVDIWFSDRLHSMQRGAHLHKNMKTEGFMLKAQTLALFVTATLACTPIPRVVRSLDGRPLGPSPMGMVERAELEHITSEARRVLEEHPRDEDAFIWLGRRLAYQGAYYEAIGVFTKGLAVHPDSAQLLRHRGHRYITVRQFDRAVQDLTRAKRLAENLPDTVEPDGAPNAAGIPRSTVRGNIQYHLGLAYYLLGRDEEACAEYQVGLDLSQNDDTLVSTGWWLYLASRRLAKTENAGHAMSIEALERIRPEMDILENGAYHHLLLMAGQHLKPEQVLPESVDSIQGSTLGYGVAAYEALNGHAKESQAIRHSILESPWWQAFGYIAAEADAWRAARLSESASDRP
jgi:tetratricopeptide (TPR) repeat protein